MSEENICKWTRIDGDFDIYWATDCGESFVLNNDEGLKANHIFFCHCCGKKIEEVIVEENPCEQEN